MGAVTFSDINDFAHGYPCFNAMQEAFGFWDNGGVVTDDAGSLEDIGMYLDAKCASSVLVVEWNRSADI